MQNSLSLRTIYVLYTVDNNSVKGEVRYRPVCALIKMFNHLWRKKSQAYQVFFKFDTSILWYLWLSRILEQVLQQVLF